MAPNKMNEKKQKGMELKASNKSKKDAVVAAAAASQEAQEWKKGADNRGADRSSAAAAKADEQARKKAEKAALVAAEEEEMSGKPVKKLSNTNSKKGGKKKNDLSLLEDALVGNADKKAKADKKAAKLKKEKADKLMLEREEKKRAEMKNMDPLLANTNAMIGNSINEGRTLNASLVAGEVDASGIDSALSGMKLAKGGAVDDHPEKRMKALHKAFEEKMLPEMKQQYPGLKRSQYLEKIFAVWKKSPENPMNWPKGV
mmetsp:Transcript_5308/g.8130  ORF Transcript_5308/g.8130 Transcript_5308/m.8130 type:complete len:258 (-) Transcript_5308:445-1218(-)